MNQALAQIVQGLFSCLLFRNCRDYSAIRSLALPLRKRIDSKKSHR
jgi:hypothetical protein